MCFRRATACSSLRPGEVEESKDVDDDNME